MAQGLGCTLCATGKTALLKEVIGKCKRTNVSSTRTSNWLEHKKLYIPLYLQGCCIASNRLFALKSSLRFQLFLE